MMYEVTVETLLEQKIKSGLLFYLREESEFAFDNDAIQLGIDTWRNVGYGRWQGAVLNTLI